MMRRSNFIYPHPSPTIRLALAITALAAVDELDQVDAEPMEVCS